MWRSGRHLLHSLIYSCKQSLLVLIFAFHVDVRIIRRRVEQDHGWILVGPMPVEFSDNLEAVYPVVGLILQEPLFQLLEGFVDTVAHFGFDRGIELFEGKDLHFPGESLVGCARSLAVALVLVIQLVQCILKRFFGANLHLRQHVVWLAAMVE